MILVPRSGVSWGPGIVTLALGVVLVAAAIGALRARGSSRAWWVALGAAVGAVGVVTVWVLQTFVLADFGLYGPGLGVYLVALGGSVSAIASLSMRARAAPPA
jgi:hypothetical protein